MSVHPLEHIALHPMGGRQHEVLPLVHLPALTLCDLAKLHPARVGWVRTCYDVATIHQRLCLTLRVCLQQFLPAQSGGLDVLFISKVQLLDGRGEALAHRRIQGERCQDAVLCSPLTFAMPLG